MPTSLRLGPFRTRCRRAVRCRRAPSQPDAAQAAAVRNIRRVVTMCVAVSAGGTFFLLYEFGFTVHPHRIGFACVLAAVYLVWSGAGLWLMHRGWMRRVRKM